MQAFNILDKSGDGAVTYADIQGVYNASKHPDVLSRRKTEQQVLTEFLNNFEVGGTVDGVITKEEFINYYANISAGIDRDDYFELMIRNSWHMSGGEGAAQNTTSLRCLVTHGDGHESLQVIENDLGLDKRDKEALLARLRSQGVRDIVNVALYGGLDTKEDGKKPRPPTMRTVSVHDADNPLKAKQNLARLRDHLSRKGATGILGMARKFKIVDDDGSGSISFEEFVKCMTECEVYLPETELRALFALCDTDKSGTISYDEFIQMVRVRIQSGRGTTTTIITIIIKVLYVCECFELGY